MKTSFNGLKVSVEGVYNAYNLTPKELESLKRRFGKKIKENNQIYTVYENFNRKIELELFVHEIWIPIKFDIKRELIRLFNSSEISNGIVEKLSKQLKQMQIQINVDYNWASNTWSIVNYDEFLKIVESVITDL